MVADARLVLSKAADSGNVNEIRLLSDAHFPFESCALAPTVVPRLVRKRVVVTYPAVQSEPDSVRRRENHNLEKLYPDD